MQQLRNIAIIAHVDHGKSTLMDNILKQSDTDLGKAGEQEMIMDWNELERERGITIFSKNAAVEYKGVKINLIDTPGHADFGGEVERILNMADGALLLVDAQEGPMPQTRFVLKKALAAGHKIIVVVNKIDKPNARVNYAVDKVLDLFIELGASDAQLEFPVVYASAKLGKAGRSPDLNAMADLTPLFETILETVPEPSANAAGPLQMMIVSIAYDNYKGRIGIGRVHQGTLRNNIAITHVSREGTMAPAKVTALMTFTGLTRAEVAEVPAGDIAAISGIENINIGDTLADAINPVPLTPIAIEKPTVKMVFSVNDSPFAGTEGEFCTSRNLKERLYKELDNDVALRVEPTDSTDSFVVSGRGELHLAIIIETMRRQGYELQVSRPEVIYKVENGKTLEPAEDVWIEVPEKYSGIVIEKMGVRKGELKNMRVEEGVAHFHFFIPTRGLIGFRNDFLIETKGTGIVNTLFAGYFPKWDDIHASPHGSLIAHESGATTAYALLMSQERGVMFLGPGAKVYEGQVVGENAKAEDLVVNVCKQKQLTNFRAKTDAVTDDLVPPRELSLEQAIEYIGGDELVEVTPQNIRLRKRILSNALRKKSEK
ncbi:MAG: translational GTPase TypA [Candidatus Liptonbacteria bacterium]|nr:translational GTPase TypA [Candidatus Liptonbacteria bacterium]